jgi:cysteine desulfurase
MKPVYLDHNATTPLAPEVLAVMLPLLKENFGNPSSVHSRGRAARVKLDEAREQTASLIHAHPTELVFTSGGTESDNLAILGVAHALKDKGRHIITSAIEHPAVLNPCRQLEADGFSVDYLPVDRSGYLDPEAVQEAVREDTILISIQHSNSEIGTIQDIRRIAGEAKSRGILIHTDAVQSAGKLPLDVEEMSVDLLSISSHKIYGPKGVGALWIKQGTPALVPRIFGGGQEKKRRGGTENVAGIVGFGRAAELAGSILDEEASRVKNIRNFFLEGLTKRVSGVHVHGNPKKGLPNTLSFSLNKVSGQSLLVRLDVEGISVSTGTACSSGATQPSEVLVALGIPENWIEETLRLSLGRETTTQDMARVLEVICGAAEAIRGRATTTP